MQTEAGFTLAVRAIAASAGTVAGVVLNKADLGTLSRYGHYSYYKNKYYHRYGYTD